MSSCGKLDLALLAVGVACVVVGVEGLDGNIVELRNINEKLEVLGQLGKAMLKLLGNIERYGGRVVKLH